MTRRNPDSPYRSREPFDFWLRDLHLSEEEFNRRCHGIDVTVLRHKRKTIDIFVVDRIAIALGHPEIVSVLYGDE
jgi:hypothetical protein